MARYKIKRELKMYPGTQWVPQGSMQPNSRLFKTFHVGDVVEGTLRPSPANTGINPKGGGVPHIDKIEVIITDAVDSQGKPYNGKAVFFINDNSFEADTVIEKPVSETDKPSAFKALDTKGISKWQMAGGVIGFGGGLYYANKKQKGVWGYIGFGILFSVAGQILGVIVSKSLTTKITTPNTDASSTPPSDKSTTDFENTFLKMKNIAIQLSNPAPDHAVAIAKWNSFSPIEKTVFMEFIDAISLLDGRDTTNFITGSERVAQSLKAKYGDAVVRKVIS